MATWDICVESSSAILNQAFKTSFDYDYAAADIQHLGLTLLSSFMHSELVQFSLAEYFEHTLIPELAAIEDKTDNIIHHVDEALVHYQNGDIEMFENTNYAKDGMGPVSLHSSGIWSVL